MNAFSAALLGSFCAASAASADTLNMSFLGVGQGRDVQITLNGITGNHFAGQLKHNLAGGTGGAAGISGVYTTFCADAMEYTGTKWATHNVLPISSLPTSYGYTAMGAERSQAIYDLYEAAGGSQLAVGANADMAAAFQVALWEIVYDFNATEGRSSMNIEAGVMKTANATGGAISGSMLTWINSFFDSVMAINATQTGLIGLGMYGRQDQVVMIPLPSAALAGLTGLAGLGALAAFRRRQK